MSFQLYVHLRIEFTLKMIGEDCPSGLKTTLLLVSNLEPLWTLFLSSRAPKMSPGLTAKEENTCLQRWRGHFLENHEIKRRQFCREDRSIGATAAQPPHYTTISDYTVMSSAYVNQPKIYHCIRQLCSNILWLVSISHFQTCQKGEGKMFSIDPFPNEIWKHTENSWYRDLCQAS